MQSLAFVFAAAAVAVAAGARPGQPVVTSETRVFSIIEVNLDAVAYKDLVTKKDYADVLIQWSVDTGGTLSWARVFLNGTVFWTGFSNTAGSASFRVYKGGRYETYIQVCNSAGCNVSEPSLTIIADTDGSHLPPLDYSMENNNIPFHQNSGKVVGSYFIEWGIYGRNFPINRVPIPNLSHLLYAFIPICGGEGINDSLEESSFQALQNACEGRKDFQVAIHDPWAALQVPLPGVNTSTDPYRGTYGQMMMLKQARPELKLLPSIGGWTLSDPFYFFNDTTKRSTFVASVKDFLETWKFFDGVDIDWEYPGGNGANANLGDPEEDGKTYIALMKELREMLDTLSAENGKSYELNSAIGSEWDKIEVVDFGTAQNYVDNFFVMTYDFFVGTSNDSLGHNAALFAPSWNPELNYTADFAVNLLLAQGVDPQKLVIGCVMYGVGWTGVHNYTDNIPFTGTATGLVDGTWEAGIVDYYVIPEGIASGKWSYFYDNIAVAPYVFNNDTGDLISFDNTMSAVLKGLYVLQNNLGGLFSWQVQGDNGDVLNGMNLGVGNIPASS